MKSGPSERRKPVLLDHFEVVLVRIRFSSVLANISIPGNFVEIQEISENSEFGVRETLFSEACIWSNICRIWMKSGWSERSISIV